jgi:hypothetical protein
MAQGVKGTGKKKVWKPRPWDETDEIQYIENMGNHSEMGLLLIMSPRGRLEHYIRVHAPSPHAHHQAGVAYCRRKLEAWNLHV